MTELQSPGLLNDVLQSILDNLCECLGENTTLGAPKDCFIYHTRAPDDCCDSLVIWLDRILPTAQFPIPFVGRDECGAVGRMMRVGVKLVRPCWPTVVDNPSNPFPPVAAMQAAAETMLIDTNVLWCCLSAGLSAGDHDPSGSCQDFHIESVIPDKPRGGCAGVTASFLVELDACPC